MENILFSVLASIVILGILMALEGRIVAWFAVANARIRSDAVSLVFAGFGLIVFVGLAISTRASAGTALAPVPDLPTIPRELFELLFVVLTGLVSMPLTSIFKRIGKTEGDATTLANRLLNVFFAGILPLVTGVYGFGLEAIGKAVAGALLGAVFDRGFYLLLLQTSQSAEKVIDVKPNPTGGSA